VVVVVVVEEVVEVVITEVDAVEEGCAPVPAGPANPAVVESRKTNARTSARSANNQPASVADVKR
jgi:hypothetical protein